MKLIIIGITLTIVGWLPVIFYFLSHWRTRRNPQKSTHDINVPAYRQHIYLVHPEHEGRYEYYLNSLWEGGDSTFDFYLIYNEETLALFEAEEIMPSEHYRYVDGISSWRTYMEVMPQKSFALVIANPHSHIISLRLESDYYPTPSYLRGGRKKAILGIILVGLVAGGLGTILAILGEVQWLMSITAS